MSFLDLQNLVDQLDHQFLILGDLNAHNPLWFGTSTNQRGRVIERLLAENNVSVLNDDSPTYFNVVHNSTSVIDLGLFSSDSYMDFVWSVSAELFDSDHYPTFVNFAVPVPSQPLPRWSLDKANRQSYSVKTSALDAILLVEDHLEAYEAFENLIYTSASESNLTTTLYTL